MRQIIRISRNAVLFFALAMASTAAFSHIGYGHYYGGYHGYYGGYYNGYRNYYGYRSVGYYPSSSYGCNTCRVWVRPTCNTCNTCSTGYWR